MVGGRWRERSAALVVAAVAGATALLVEAARRPDRRYVSAAISLDLMVAMVLAGLIGALVEGKQAPRRGAALAAVAASGTTVVLRAQGGPLQAATKEALALLAVAVALTVWAALPLVRGWREPEVRDGARWLGTAAAAFALGTAAGSIGAHPAVREARGGAILAATVVAGLALLTGARDAGRARKPVIVLAAGAVAARSWGDADRLGSAAWVGLLVAATTASWTTSADRSRLTAGVRSQSQRMLARWARGPSGPSAGAPTRRVRREQRREARRRRRATVAPARLCEIADLSPRARWTAGALALATAIVVALVTVRARQLGWYPIGDDAIIATRAGDVGGRRTPLLGIPTSLGPLGPEGLEVRHPGPLLFWIYSPFVHLLGPAAGVMAGAACITLGSIAAACWGAFRARGPLAGLLAHALMLAVAVTAAAGVPFEPLNAFAPVLPLAATLVLAWAVASGVDRALAPTVAFASLCIQSYLPLAPTAGVVLVLAIASAVVPSLRHPATPRPDRRALATAGLVAVLAWSGPIIDVVANRGGNVWRLLTLEQTGAPALGIDGGWHALLRLTSLPPAWAAPVPFRADEAGSLLSGGNATGAALLVSAVAIARWRWPVWDHGVRRLVLLAAIALVVAAATMVRLPSEFVFAYQVGWASVTGAFAAFAIAVVVVAEADGPPRRADRVRPAGLGISLGIVVVLLATLAWPGDLERYSSVAASSQRAASALGEQLGAGPSPGRPIAIFASGRSWEQVIANGVTMELEHRGREVRVSPLIGEHWGTWRLEAQAPADPVLIVSDGFSPGTPPGRLVARVEPDGWSAERAEEVAGRVASWARDQGPIVVRPGLGGLLRSVAETWVPDLPCDELDELLAGRSTLDGLPDGAIAQLYLEGVVASPALPEDLLDLVLGDLVATPTEVWLADASKARASIDGPVAGRCA